MENFSNFHRFTGRMDIDRQESHYFVSKLDNILFKRESSENHQKLSSLLRCEAWDEVNIQTHCTRAAESQFPFRGFHSGP